MTGDTVNDSIAQGKFTVMFQIQKLGSGTDYNPLLTQLYDCRRSQPDRCADTGCDGPFAAIGTGCP